MVVSTLKTPLVVLILSVFRGILNFRDGSLRRGGDLLSGEGDFALSGEDNICFSSNSSDFFFLNNPVKILVLFFLAFIGGDADGDDDGEVEDEGDAGMLGGVAALNG